MDSSDAIFEPFWNKLIIVSVTPRGDTRDSIINMLGEDQHWFVCVDGGFLCHACVHLNVQVIMPATITIEPAQEDKQWRIVGAQEINIDPALESLEQCAHCGAKHPTE